jgi:hypothetical protein
VEATMRRNAAVGRDKAEEYQKRVRERVGLAG